eukprot:UN06591
MFAAKSAFEPCTFREKFRQKVHGLKSFFAAKSAFEPCTFGEMYD